MLRKIIIGLFSVNLLFCANAHAEELITVNQFVSHPALDAVFKGIKESIENSARSKPKIQMQNAQGSVQTAVQIAKQQASLNPRVMVAIATPSAQANLKARQNNTNITLAFAAVTDPKAAGLSNAKNVIGVTDNPSIAELVKILKQTMPSAKRIGIVYNAGEINSVKMVEELTKQASGMTIQTAAVNSTANVGMTAQKIASTSDVIFLPLDNMVVSAIEVLLKAANNKKIPVIATDPSLVDKGLLFAIGADYEKQGRDLGTMILDRIANNKTNQEIKNSGSIELKFNAKVAESLGIAIPDQSNKKGEL